MAKIIKVTTYELEHKVVKSGTWTNGMDCSSYGYVTKYYCEKCKHILLGSHINYCHNCGVELDDIIEESEAPSY